MERPGEGLGKEIYEWTHRKQEAPREAMPNSKPDSMNSKLDSMNSKSDSMNLKLDSMNSKLDSMNSKSDSMNSKLDSMNSKSDSMNLKPDSMNLKSDSMNLKPDSIEEMPPQPRLPVDQQATAARAAQVADIMMLTYSDWNGIPLLPDAERGYVKAECERLGANLEEIKRSLENKVSFFKRLLQTQHGVYKGDHEEDLGFNSGTASGVSLVTPPRAPAREQAASGAVRLGVKQRCFP
jgi:chromosome segregation ATPase